MAGFKSAIRMAEMSEARRRAELEAEIANLERIEVLVETNSGTFGPHEACAKVGTGDPAFATRNVYEAVGTGKRRATGPDEGDAPGYMRAGNTETMARHRKALAELRRRLREGN